MKIKTQTIVSQTDLDAAGKTWGFGAAHAFVEFGKEDGKGNRVFDSEIWSRIVHGYKGKAPPHAPMTFAPMGKFTPPTDEQLAAWLKICEACPSVLKTNGVLKCGHARQTCATCGQGISGLATVLKTFSFACPEKKLKL